ncbi:Phycobilisome degradation protein NblA (plasmid) [Nostoc flagelliforme CCNUN1]|uniref:Phycobilisome degradation protein NblA n=1 Tax=Nostoc flagelliforme CCNUN1 TaxID=2038116 RepID=A0A2K8T9C7_9NOSO|nr:Phycobilisome degradation protein NblA [Nostoc flagelliforme CCNUN1]AUB44806.1 Phycobilisome degradation protein NblA [Nostoc flagelliforme CCNUN1]
MNKFALFLVMLYKQMIAREATYQELLKHRWKIDSDAIFG